MDDDCYLVTLPVEILHKIFKYNCLNYRDISRLGSTSSYLRSVVNDNELWKTKFFQSWERAGVGDIYEGLTDIDWRKETEIKLKVGRAVTSRLDLMSVTYRGLGELSHRQFKPFLQLAASHPRALHFVIDHLMSIINDNDKRCNLARKYYGMKVLRQMQQVRLRGVWEGIVTRSERKQILEEGAFFLGQWQYPNMDVVYSHIRKELDELANEVMDVLKESTGGRHPLLGEEGRNPEWRDNMLEDNIWTPDQCRQIIWATSNLLFARKGFRVRRCIYQNLPINKGLKVKDCDLLTISIIYEAILRRLGVKCDLISTSCHFLLGWSEVYPCDREYPDESTCIIDMRNEGAIIKNPYTKINNRCIIDPNQGSLISTSIEMVKRMGNKMLFTYTYSQNEDHNFDHVSRLRSTFEMVLVTNPDHFNNYIQLMNFYDINGIEIDPDLLDKFLVLLPNLSTVQLTSVNCFLNSSRRVHNEEEMEGLNMTLVKHRSGEIKFAIGLVMEHKQYGYRCVIYGWDNKCTASSIWRQKMRVYQLQYKDKQPFYNVLVNDGSLRYAAQENLKLVEEETEVEVPEVGRYFVRWCGKYYEPTAMKSGEYPHDSEARAVILGLTRR